ncbi:MAG: flagellar biosynthetic protein FliO [Lachnospiraceae bacterium]|nr:flagellar biosynthetic protein FliO [Lachnospiraceae bacterium]
MTMLIAADSSLDNFLRFLASLGIFLFVLALAYFVTRWIGNYQKFQLKSRNIQVIETMRIANNKYVQIVKVAEEYLVISIAKERIELLTKLDEKNINALHIPDEKHTETFQDILKKLKANKK